MNWLTFWRQRRFWTEGWGSLGLAVLVALFIRWLLFEAYVIPSGSMLPSLLIQDHIFVNKLVYGVRVPFSEKWLVKFSEPKRGEIIVFKYPRDMSTFYIKRIVAVAGDTVEYNDGVLYVNGKAVERVPPVTEEDYRWLTDETFQRDAGRPGDSLSMYVHFTELLGDVKHSILMRKYVADPLSMRPLLIRPGQVFVMGDNRDNSSDSRVWGPLQVDNILGRASVVWLSCDRPLPVVGLLCNPFTMRWTRLGHFVH